MRSEERIQELTYFQNKVGVPAVFGGVISAAGTLELDVVGVRRRGHQEKIAASDRVHIGSCCKMITAALFGTFVAEGRAAWDMSIVDLFPDLADSIAEEWRQRSVAEFFYCLSGMMANPPRRILVSGHLDNRPLPEQRTALAKLAFSQPPRKPGRFVYSNMSYIVLGAAIDRLCGGSYERALESRVFAPLGITSAGYGPPPTVWGHSPKVFIGGLALFKGKPADPVDSKSDNPPVLSSAGTLHLNCEDWAKLLHLFQVNCRFSIIEESLIEQILRLPQRPGARMSMGWAPVDLDGIRYAAQGSNVFWSATVLMDEARQRISVVVCNDGRSSVLRKSVLLAQRLLR